MEGGEREERRGQKEVREGKEQSQLRCGLGSTPATIIPLLNAPPAPVSILDCNTCMYPLALFPQDLLLKLMFCSLSSDGRC